MTSDHAAEIARTALIWLSGQPEVLSRLLVASGLAPADLRHRADDPEFLGFLLELLLVDEASAVAFAADAGLPPDAALRARAALPGGDTPSWT